MGKEKPKGLDPSVREAISSVREAISFTIKVHERLNRIFQSYEAALERREGFEVWKQFKDEDEAVAHFAKFLYDHFGQNLQSEEENLELEKEWIVEYSVPGGQKRTATIKAPTKIHAKVLWEREGPALATIFSITEKPNDSGTMPEGTESLGVDAESGMVDDVSILPPEKQTP